MTESLLLDEHYPPVLAQRLRQEGFDVIAVAEIPTLQGAPDDEVYQIAIDQGRRVITENIRDFRPLLTLALSRGTSFAPLLFTTAKKYSRRASALGALTTALRAWLRSTDPQQVEEWL